MANLTPQKGVSHVETFKVAGVTYNNRQQNLKMIQEQINKGKKLNIGIEQYDYKGHPAVSVTVNGLDIGNLHQKDADYVLANQDRILGFINLFIDKFNNEEGKTIYYARVELLVKNKTVSNEKATKAETSAPTVQAPNALGYRRRGAYRHLYHRQHCRTDSQIKKAALLDWSSNRAATTTHKAR